jgi:CHAT domain-containing protein
VDELVRSPALREGESLDDYFPRVEAARGRWDAVSRALANVLLGPFIQTLRQRRLLVVGHEGLHRVPFAALPVGSEGSKPLLTTREVVRIPSAVTLSLLRRDAPQAFVPPTSVLVVADPVFSTADPRVRAGEPGDPEDGAPSAVMMFRGRSRSRGGGALDLANLPRLRASGDEASDIVRLAGSDRVSVLGGFAARRERVLGATAREYGIVHLASHSFPDDENPELSSVVLSMVDERGSPLDGMLLLKDVYDMKLSAELVVLSACETALGKEIRGEGILGLTRGFLHAGARRVVASLWKVDDKATRALMAKFYEGLFRDHLAPGAALRRAQLALAADPRWAFPFYWSAFELHGEWR